MLYCRPPNNDKKKIFTTNAYYNINVGEDKNWLIFTEKTDNEIDNDLHNIM